MGTILLTFLKQIPREGFKSLAVPLLTMVLVVLISIISGAQEQLVIGLEDVIDRYEVRVEVSDPITAATENLEIDLYHIMLFTDETINRSLAGYLRDVEKKRTLPIFDIYPFVPAGQWVGITSPAADSRLDRMTGAEIIFFPGYDESIFRTRERVGVVSPETFATLDADNPILKLTMPYAAPPLTGGEGNIVYKEMEIRVVGIVRGAGNHVFSPFWTVSDTAETLALPVYTSLMRAYIANNRLITDFVGIAKYHFSRAGDLNAPLPFALTVYDTIYNDVVRRLQQNIQLIAVATPFIYVLSILIGFIASYLFTRRKKLEFAILRSMGVNKRHVFWSALAEQAFLCILGVAVGCAGFTVLYGNWLWLPPVLFTGCYVLGSAFTTRQATETDILKSLREKE
jgi:hypothetical protein